MRRRRKRFIQLCRCSTTQRRAIARQVGQGLGFLSAGTDRSRHAKRIPPITDCLIIVAFVQTHALWDIRVWTGRYQCREGRLNQLHIRSVERQSEPRALGVPLQQRSRWAFQQRRVSVGVGVPSPLSITLITVGAGWRTCVALAPDGRTTPASSLRGEKRVFLPLCRVVGHVALDFDKRRLRTDDMIVITPLPDLQSRIVARLTDAPRNTGFVRPHDCTQ